MRIHRRATAASVGRTARGIVLLALLLVLALLGIGLMVAVDVWSVTRQRERESELLFVGDQYRQAIQRYYYGAPPGEGRALPPSLEVLLDDDRYPVPVHYLRRLYPDPITGSSEWGILRAGDRIIGVYSMSETHPLKQAGFPLLYQFFSDKTSYRDWAFTFVGSRRSGIGTAVPLVPSSPPSVDSPFPSIGPTRGNPS